MENKNIEYVKETLIKQMELLHERSKNCNDDIYLSQLTKAIVEIAELFKN